MNSYIKAAIIAAALVGVGVAADAANQNYGPLQAQNNLAELTPSASTARSNLGLGTMATVNSPVGVGNGGTGVTTLTAHGTLVGEGSGNVVATSPGTAGQVLTSNGSGSDPTYQAIPSTPTTVSPTVSAAGSGQGTATALTSDINVVTTVATGTGVILPTPTVGQTIVVLNRGANTLTVYPQTGGQIENIALNNGIQVAVGASVTMIPATSTQWYVGG